MIKWFSYSEELVYDSEEFISYFSLQSELKKLEPLNHNPKYFREVTNTFLFFFETSFSASFRTIRYQFISDPENTSFDFSFFYRINSPNWIILEGPKMVHSFDRQLPILELIFWQNWSIDTRNMKWRKLMFRGTRRRSKQLEWRRYLRSRGSCFWIVSQKKCIDSNSQTLIKLPPIDFHVAHQIVNSKMPQ